MITVTLVGDNEVRARLKAMGYRVHTFVRRAIEREAVYETGYVKSRKLSGQVLNVRTGTLRRSINYQITDNSAGIYASVGTNVIYGRIHEYGGMVVRVSSKGKTYSARFPVRSFLRTTLRDNRERIVTAMRQAVEQAVYGA